MPDALALPPAPLDDGGPPAVAVDVEAVDARLTFDVAGREGRGHATVRFGVDGPGGRPALDLRQEIDEVRLDGRPLPPAAFAHRDLGGGDGAAMRVLDVAVQPGSRHELEVAYRLATPAAVGAVPVGWGDDGVRFDLWMSDLEPGRYLEMWVPAPLCHDRFALAVDVEVTGTGRPHTLVANGAVTGLTVRYPPSFTALSPMLVLAPSDEVESVARTVAVAGRDAPLGVRCFRHRELDADLEACAADVAGWLAHLAARYGPWAHGDDMTVFLWGPGRGMEYDGATTASVGALEHEVFHSWFGRGLKPARASDGWIDEAWTSWATSSRRVELPRFHAEELPLDAPPVLLAPPHPWSRFTPRPSYAEGARLFAGLAWLFGGSDRLRSAMADWYQAHRGGLISTEGLGEHLSRWSGVDISPWWDRYVHGLDASSSPSSSSSSDGVGGED